MAKKEIDLIDQKAQKLISQGRAFICLKHGFFGPTLLSLRVKRADWVGTMGVDGVNLFYSAKWTSELTFDRVVTVLLHETLHVILLHHIRRLGRDPHDWNVAGDHVINLTLSTIGCKFWDGALCNPKFNGMHTEQVFELVKQDKPPEQPKADQDQGQDGQGQGSNQGGQGQGGNQGDQDDPGSSESGPSSSNELGDGKGEAGDKNGQGGAKNGAPSEDQGQAGFEDHGGCGKVLDAPPGIDYNKEEQDIKIRIAQGMHIAETAGTMPGALKRLCEELLKPKVDWKEVLASDIEFLGRNDYDWRIPNRNYISSGVFLPALESPEPGRVAVFQDLSGSMTQAIINQHLSEVQAIFATYPTITLDVYGFDTEVDPSEVYEVTQDTDVTDLKWDKGGGTAFCAPFDYIRENVTEDYKLILVMTDGFAWDWPVDPEIPVIWVLPHKIAFDPPVGRVIFMED